MRVKIVDSDYDPRTHVERVTLSIPGDDWNALHAIKGDVVDVRNMQAVEHEQRVYARMLDALRAAETWFRRAHPTAPERSAINQAIGAGRTLINE